ncbi:hypothetical protein A4A49_62848, partial [Nicotiana attenuata]
LLQDSFNKMMVSSLPSNNICSSSLQCPLFTCVKAVWLPYFDHLDNSYQKGMIVISDRDAKNIESCSFCLGMERVGDE